MKSQTQILAIDLTNRENFKKTSLLEIGTKAKVSLPGALLSADRENTFRKECLHFYVAVASYLKVNLRFDASLFKHSQYLQPEKRNLSGSTNAISNLALIEGAALKNNISDIFHVNTKKELCDKIRKLWLWYQNETIPVDLYLLTETSQNSQSRQPSYREQALEKCELNPVDRNPSKYKRIDHYWNKIGDILDEDGSLKYTQLFSPVKCILSFSHSNSSPERGFSINKILLDAHGTNLKDDTMVAIRLGMFM